MSAFTLPDIQRSSPVTVTRDCPVLDVLQPVTKTSLTDGFRNPVNGIIVADEVISYRGLTDIPGLTCIVDERCVTSPAVRILMLELRSCKQLALCIQILQNNRICILYKHSCICSLFGHLTLTVYKLYKRKVIFASYLRVVFTECRCDVYDTGTVGHGNVSVTGYIMCLLILLLRALCSTCEERFVFLILEFLTLIGFQNLISFYTIFLVSKLAKYTVQKCLCHVVGSSVSSLYLAVGLIRIHTKCHVGRQGPRSRGPYEEICILTAYLEGSDCGTFLYGLIALRYLSSRQRGTAARAVRNNLETFV